MPHNQRTIPDLPDDVVLSVRNVSKKFCRNLKRSLWYGVQDLSENLLGKTADRRPQTTDLFKGSASGGTDAGQAVGKLEDPKSLQSAVCGLQSSSDGLQSAVCGLQSSSEVYSLQSAVFSLPPMVYSLQSAVCSLIPTASARRNSGPSGISRLTCGAGNAWA